MMSTLSPEAPEKLLLTPHEAAHVLGICERKLWAETAPRGSIPRIKIGRNVRYSRAALEAWVDEQSAKAV